MTILTAAQSDDRRATLIAMRDKLAADMDIAPAAVVAQIAGRLSVVLAEIESIAEPGKVSKFDELEQRRKDRIAAADKSKPAKRAARKRTGT